MLETVRKYYFYWHKKCLEEPSQLSRAKTYKTPLTVIPKYFSRKPSAASRISCCFSSCFCSCPICGHLFPGDLLKGVPNNPFQGQPGEDLLKDTVMGSTFRAERPHSSHLLLSALLECLEEDIPVTFSGDGFVSHGGTLANQIKLELPLQPLSGRSRREGFTLTR